MSTRAGRVVYLDEIMEKIVDLANVHSEGRIISFLEGGYDLLALSESIKEHFLALNIFLGDPDSGV